jgi:hypothetical protein
MAQAASGPYSKLKPRSPKGLRKEALLGSLRSLNYVGLALLGGAKALRLATLTQGFVRGRAVAAPGKSRAPTGAAQGKGLTRA